VKLKFKNQQFQTDAVNAVVGLFDGQKRGHGTFTVTSGEQMSLMENDRGYSNALTMDI